MSQTDDQHQTIFDLELYTGGLGLVEAVSRSSSLPSAAGPSRWTGCASGACMAAESETIGPSGERDYHEKEQTTILMRM